MKDALKIYCRKVNIEDMEADHENLVRCYVYNELRAKERERERERET
jgi:hypothetical protein